MELDARSNQMWARMIDELALARSAADWAAIPGEGTMKTYITSDLHFSHSSMLRYNPQTRAYTNVRHMNDSMIAEWNKIVASDDLVYILGDFAFSNAKRAIKIVCQLNGRKILVCGNHDRILVQNDGFRAYFESIHDYLTVDYNGTLVCMFHYPILEWDKCHRGAVHFHGHVHGKPTGLERYRVRDVGIDATGVVVASMDDMIASVQKNALKPHGG